MDILEERRRTVRITLSEIKKKFNINKPVIDVRYDQYADRIELILIEEKMKFIKKHIEDE